MKIIINYDFVEALKDANQPYGTMKILRNNIYNHLKINFPVMLVTSIGLNATPERMANIPYVFVGSAIIFEGTQLLANYVSYKITNNDIYKLAAEIRLLKLSANLINNNISTDYNLLLQSEYYDHITKLSLDDKKTPIITSKKYILVPTYTYSGDIEDTSIEQEHVLGTKDYVLSVGTPRRVRKLVPVKSNI